MTRFRILTRRVVVAANQQALALQPSNDGGSRVAAGGAQRGNLPTLCGIDPLERSAELRAEQRLLLAVLEQAIWTFQRYADSGNRRGRRLFGEVETWFGSDDTTWTFSFVPVCDALGFDPAYLRSGLRRWREGERPSIRGVPRFVAPPGQRRDRQAALATS
jgi:hypothetical protein